MLGGRKKAEGCQRVSLTGYSSTIPHSSFPTCPFGHSGLSVSAVRVIWCRDWINQAASAGKEQGARSV